MADFKLKPWNRGISNSELLEDLKRVAGVIGKNTVGYNEYPNHGRCASRIFETRFGSWNAALKAAGLEVTRRYDVSDEELFENMEHVWTALGRQPRRQELKRPLSKYSGGIYERRFGGWRNALEKFVAFASGEEIAVTTRESFSIQNKDARSPDLRMRWHVLNRDAFRCRSCGRSPAIDRGVILHVDHIVPWSKGGKTEERNLQTLCEQCNLGKGNLYQEDV